MGGARGKRNRFRVERFPDPFLSLSKLRLNLNSSLQFPFPTGLPYTNLNPVKNHCIMSCVHTCAVQSRRAPCRSVWYLPWTATGGLKD